MFLELPKADKTRATSMNPFIEEGFICKSLLFLLSLLFIHFFFSKSGGKREYKVT